MKNVSMRISKAEALGRHLGGKWTYDHCASWWCDDGVRHVSRCMTAEGEYGEPGVIQYWLYSAGPGRRAEEYLYVMQETSA